MTELSHAGFEAADEIVGAAVTNATDLLSAYVSNNSIDADKLAPMLEKLIDTYDRRLRGAAGRQAAPAPNTTSSFVAAPAQAAAPAEPEAAAAPTRTAARSAHPASTTASSAEAAGEGAGAGADEEETEVGADGVNPMKVRMPRPKPAVSPRDSEPKHGQFLICLEDGAELKTLKRHLRTKYNMTPRQYKKRWNLPDDYPMTAKLYSEERSKLARTQGFGARETTKA